MTIYAPEQDYKYLKSQNPYADIQLYTPGARLTANDIALGGINALGGISNENLGGAKRLYGNDATGTANEYYKYLASQTPKAQAQTPTITSQQVPKSSLLPASDPMSSIIGDDPEALAYYKQAQQAAKLGSQNAMETLNSRGILNSSVTGDTVTGLEQQAVTNILPQLYAFQEQKKQQARQDAYNRMTMLGYADNEVATVLGIPVGTPSADYSLQQAGLTLQQAGLTGVLGQTQTGANDYLIGGTAVIPEGTQGQRIAGLTAEDTANEIAKAAQGILARSQQTPVTVYYRNDVDLQNARRYLGDNVTYKQWSPGQQTLAAQGQTQEQDQLKWERAFQDQGFNADQAYRAAQIAMQQQELDANNAYRYAALAQSGNGTNISELNYLDKQNVTAATNDAFAVLNNLANQGKSRTEIINYLNQHSSEFSDVDYDALLSRVQKAFTWDKDANGNWYNTFVNKDPNG